MKRFDSSHDNAVLLSDRLQTQLPDEYVDLEKRVDALKQVHQNLLNVT